MLGPPHQDRDFVLARHHAAINADIHHAAVVILGDAAPIGEEIAPAIKAVPPRRRQLVEIDIVAGDDVLFHRTGADDLRRHGTAEHIAAELDQIARVGVGGDPEHHGDAAVTREPAAEHAAATRIRPIVPDVVEHHGRAVAGALGEPHHGADLDVPIDLGIDLLNFSGGMQRLDPAAKIAVGDRLAFDVHCLFPEMPCRPVCPENHIRVYCGCSPNRIGTAIAIPLAWTAVGTTRRDNASGSRGAAGPGVQTGDRRAPEMVRTSITSAREATSANAIGSAPVIHTCDPSRSRASKRAARLSGSRCATTSSSRITGAVPVMFPTNAAWASTSPISNAFCSPVEALLAAMAFSR